MKPKFKIGEVVKYIGGGLFNGEKAKIKKVYNPRSKKMYNHYDLGLCRVEVDINTPEHTIEKWIEPNTSEQIAVEKALKEFKGKMQKEVEQEIRYLKGELKKTSNNWDKRGYAIRNCVYQTGYKLLKLLNEADDLMSGEEYLKKLELLK